jgi:formylmethanofuran dehydrogenase subunit E
MSLRNVTLKKSMNKDEVNNMIDSYVQLYDEVFEGANIYHNWKCKCGNVFNRRWDSVKTGKFANFCPSCSKIKKQEEISESYKKIVEKDMEYKFIKAYFKGDILPNGKVVNNNRYIEIIHIYCNSSYIVPVEHFKRGARCGKCCGSYENSFAYHIEVELGEPLDKYWDFEKNTLNPYHITKSTDKKVWIKCQEKDYHNSYNTIPHVFSKGVRCPYCTSTRVHYLDSFATNRQKIYKKIKEFNNIDFYSVSLGSGKKVNIKCDKCGGIFKRSIASLKEDNQVCKQCSKSKGEKSIIKFLENNSIPYREEKEFNNLVGLGGQNLRYDFYLPEHNLLIEYQGQFHDGTAHQQSKKEFERQQEHDKRKREYAKDNNIKLLEIWYYDFDNIEEILKKRCLDEFVK